jgi:iron complex transport system permease protein
VTGIISFVGLLAPHAARLTLKDSRVNTLWLSGILGSALLCFADILARSVTVNELPVSIFTSILGAPFLIYLMMRKGELHE